MSVPTISSSINAAKLPQPARLVLTPIPSHSIPSHILQISRQRRPWTNIPFSPRRKGVDWLGKSQQAAGKTGTSRKDPCRTNEIVTKSVHQLYSIKNGASQYDNLSYRLQQLSKSSDALPNRISIFDIQSSIFVCFRLPAPNLLESCR